MPINAVVLIEEKIFLLELNILFSTSLPSHPPILLLFSWLLYEDTTSNFQFFSSPFLTCIVFANEILLKESCGVMVVVVCIPLRDELIIEEVMSTLMGLPLYADTIPPITPEGIV